jgi:GTP cyclohydrolase II
VHVHAACPAGERFGSLLCDCSEQLGHALRDIAATGAGVLIYARGHDEASDGLVTGLSTCARRAPRTGEAASWARLDAGAHRVAAAILHALGLHHVRLLTNDPREREGLRAHGLDVEDVASPAAEADDPVAATAAIRHRA